MGARVASSRIPQHECERDDMNWIAVSIETLPVNGMVVETKIDDGIGPAMNEQQLKRQGRLWFFPDGSMYVYYTPTHWRETEKASVTT
jgi:hypothetical protein